MNYPKYLTKNELASVLRDMADVVETEDSFEGEIQYSFPEDGDDPHGFRVRAGYRVGNSMGQGSLRMIAEGL